MVEANYNSTIRESAAYEKRKNADENLKFKGLERITSLALTGSLFILFNNSMINKMVHWYFT